MNGLCFAGGDGIFRCGYPCKHHDRVLEDVHGTLIQPSAATQFSYFLSQ